MSDPLLEQFRKNFEYDHWANGLYLKALEEMPSPPEKAVKLLAHMVFAKGVWLARVLKEDLSGFRDPHPNYTLAESRQKFDVLHEKWKAYLGSLTSEGLEVTFIVPNTQGKLSEHKVQNVIMQVINHGTYHRGQLATLVHQGGGARPGTDYINYAYQIGESKFV